MKKIKSISLIVAMFAAALALTGCNQSTAAVKDGGMHKVVIQVSTDNPRTQTIALNNAVNMRKALGRDNVDVVIVAYGPGLGMLTQHPNNKNAERVTSLAMEGVKFDACGNTMKKVAKKTGHMPKVLEGVTVVPGGVIKIMELQEQGYAYIRP